MVVIMKLIKKIVKNTFYFLNEIKFRGKISVDKNKLNDLEQIIDENIKVDKIIPIRLPKNDNSYKWDGAINYNQNMYCIANSVNEVLKLNLENDKIKYLNINIPNSEKFKWTGGCKYNHRHNRQLSLRHEVQDTCLLQASLTQTNRSRQGCRYL